MKRALLIFLAAAAAIAQQRTNIITIIPITNPTTGAPSAAGEVRFLDLGSHYVGLKGPASVSTNIVFQLPAADGSSGKCWGWASAAVLDWVSCSSSLPIDDSLTIFSNHADPTKLVKVSLSALTTATTRMLSVQDANYILAGVNVDNQFSSVQHFQSDILPNGAVNLGAASATFTNIYGSDVFAGTLQIGSPLLIGTKYFVGIDSGTASLAITSVIGTLFEFSGGGQNTSYANLFPSTTATLDLGGPGAYWENGYIDHLHVNSCAGAGCGASPFTDATAILFNSSDNTKLLKFALGGLTTATTRTLTPQNNDYTLAGVNIDNQFSTSQHFQNDILPNGAVNIGAAATTFTSAYATTLFGGSMQVGSPFPITGTHYTIGIDGGTSAMAVTSSSATLFEFSGGGENTSYSTLAPSTTGLGLGKTGKHWGTLWVDNIGSTILPDTNAVYDLGSTSFAFANMWAANVHTVGITPLIDGALYLGTLTGPLRWKNAYLSDIAGSGVRCLQSANDGSINLAAAGCSAAPAFSSLLTGVNASATMTVGAGASFILANNNPLKALDTGSSAQNLLTLNGSNDEIIGSASGVRNIYFYNSASPAMLIDTAQNVTLSSLAGVGTVPACADTNGKFVRTGCGGASGLADPGGNGIVVRTALNTTINRQITGTSPITVTNNDGTVGNPTVACSTCALSPVAWSTSTLSSGTGWTSLSVTEAWTVSGKTTSFTLSGSGTSNGGSPVITLPLTSNRAAIAACNITDFTGGGTIAGYLSIPASSANSQLATYSASIPFTNAHVYLLACSGTYETT